MEGRIYSRIKLNIYSRSEMKIIYIIFISDFHILIYGYGKICGPPKPICGKTL